MTEIVNTETGEIVEPLTAMERSKLTHAEAKIERGLSSFLEVGEALGDVRDGRLYRDEFGTFEAYCRERWGITDRRARQMIDAAEVVASMPTGTTVPVNEAQARELVGLAPAEAATVMTSASAATSGHVTAAAIREARNPQTSTPPVDEAGEVERPKAGSEISPPPSVRDHVDLTAFINADPTVQLTSWRRSFMTHIKRAIEITLFTPEDVAQKADIELIDELERLSKDLANYVARVQAKRPTRLTAIRGGAK